MKTNQQIGTKQDIKKAQAIELWRETRGHISNICRAIGIDRTTFYNWLKADKGFATALLDAEYELNDDVRDALVQKIADGDMAAIIFYLKKRHPDFLDRPNLTQVNINEMKLEVTEDVEEVKPLAVPSVPGPA